MQRATGAAGLRHGAVAPVLLAVPQLEEPRGIVDRGVVVGQPRLEQQDAHARIDEAARDDRAGRARSDDDHVGGVDACILVLRHAAPSRSCRRDLQDVVAFEELAHAALERLAVVARDERPGHAHRIAEEEVLVERLPSGERRQAGVPREAEEPDALGAVQRRALEVALDVVVRRAEHVGLGRERHQAARADLAQDLHQPRVGARVPVAARVERRPGRRHEPEAVRLGVDLGGAQERLARLEGDDHLGRLLLDVLELLDADRLGQQRDEAEDELRLRARARHDLVGHVRRGAGLGVDRVAELRLPDDEAPLPGNEDVVEHDDRIDLLEARRERMVEVAAAEVEALATEEAQAGRVARDARTRTSRARRRACP